MKFLLLLALACLSGVQGQITIGSVSTGDCICSTTVVNGRDGGGLSHAVITQLQTGDCATFQGGTATADGYQWFQINFFGQTLWVAGDYFNRGSGCSSATCPSIVSRSAWGARPTSWVEYQSHPADYAFIHHSASGDCFDRDSCAASVRSFQNYHMDTHGWGDIGYTFVIGGDGSIFEARGWDQVGAHTLGYNYNGFGFCLVGNFMDHAPTAAAIQSTKDIIACGVAMGKLKSAYTLRGHRDMGSTACPGDVLYNMIQSWPHY